MAIHTVAVLVEPHGLVAAAGCFSHFLMLPQPGARYLPISGASLSRTASGMASGAVMMAPARALPQPQRLGSLMAFTAVAAMIALASLTLEAKVFRTISMETWS